ncbi:hypothetical protein C8R45DRAFT_1112546 [Mycena sanguinolenta]|nr:hypothetical protein C8R45DRAFT_1112546 [Mycena sanguinolenta]
MIAQRSLLHCVCPVLPLRTDLGGHDVIFSFDDSDVNGLYCLYGGLDVCVYDSSSGALVFDGDSGLCQDHTVVSCATRRRYKGEDNYTAFLRKRKSAAMKAQTSKPRQLAADPQKLKGRKPSVAL